MSFWKLGRSGGGYRQLKIFSFWKIDCYLIRIPELTEVKWHKDPVKPGFEHHRLNIFLKHAKQGGYIETQETDAYKCYNGSLFMKFRPDLILHRVSLVVEGDIWILSFGWLKHEKRSTV